ncbi:hypothetical protein [Nocardia brasiliensis]|uniref:hypothetical protein n=1 Tax=Nocardia brasiliensis TaxID=37326 RepID=UPI00366E5539
MTQRDGERADEFQPGVRHQIVQRLDVVLQQLLHLAGGSLAEPAEWNPGQFRREQGAQRQLVARVHLMRPGQRGRLQQPAGEEHDNGDQQQTPDPIGIDLVGQQFPACLDDQHERNHGAHRGNRDDDARQVERPPYGCQNLPARQGFLLLSHLPHRSRGSVARLRRQQRRDLHRHTLLPLAMLGLPTGSGPSSHRTSREGRLA